MCKMAADLRRHLHTHTQRSRFPSRFDLGFQLGLRAASRNAITHHLGVVASISALPYLVVMEWPLQDGRRQSRWAGLNRLTRRRLGSVIKELPFHGGAHHGQTRIGTPRRLCSKGLAVPNRNRTTDKLWLIAVPKSDKSEAVKTCAVHAVNP